MEALGVVTVDEDAESMTPSFSGLTFTVILDDSPPFRHPLNRACFGADWVWLNFFGISWNNGIEFLIFVHGQGLNRKNYWCSHIIYCLLSNSPNQSLSSLIIDAFNCNGAMLFDTNPQMWRRLLIGRPLSNRAIPLSQKEVVIGVISLMARCCKAG